MSETFEPVGDRCVVFFFLSQLCFRRVTEYFLVLDRILHSCGAYAVPTHRAHSYYFRSGHSLYFRWLRLNIGVGNVCWRLEMFSVGEKELISSLSVVYLTYYHF